MKIITSFKKIKNPKPSAVAIGSFDGVHLGHQAIIQKLISIAEKNQLQPYILFFEPLPKEFFLKENAPTRIYDFRNKIINLHNLGLQNIICQKFNSNFANIEAEDFIKEYLIKKLNTKHIIVGDDFKFGKKRKGDYNLLKTFSTKNDFKVDKVSSLNLDNHRISSSQIRQAIIEHNLGQASKLLGRSLKINSRVIHGQKNGRKIGFHTANQKLPKNSALKGVYLTKVFFNNGESFYGVSNAGTRPTVDGKNNLLETHIFNFNKDIYGQYITIEIIDFIREEKKFKSFEELKSQISNDIKVAKNLISTL
ncbi:riboflavin biosynthesis protein [Francisella halioticida]|uniref:Riboflavin biosynthesis protein n=1 Tax=Francisella halioticida TaxID=549298 RepID=A0ABM6M0W2_9GAMM|nr:bifunctional riboflavin kinase/FAD synthetase [Francisella halioticida]ASG68607.1 riboflavin biosynthesis protein RibF [Francisella halioticida]BCD91514.1 riboflavin biosynthesis protein [Francisella halioticida]